MKKYIIITLLACLAMLHETYGQRQTGNPIEIGKWRFEQDMKSMWEFKINGKVHKTYDGRNTNIIYSYTISSTPPVCPGAQLAVKPNVDFLKLVNDKDGDISCFYIYALNAERLTVVDAIRGHIFPSVRVEE
ncbi:MAG: hypothetical protein WBA74_22975 [Cyclobacteriaceae bacterium]